MEACAGKYYIKYCQKYQVFKTSFCVSPTEERPKGKSSANDSLQEGMREHCLVTFCLYCFFPLDWSYFLQDIVNKSLINVRSDSLEGRGTSAICERVSHFCK